MKLIKLSCCNCGANLEVNNELKNVYCNYCGQNFLLDDEIIKIEHVVNDFEGKINNALTYLNDFRDYEKAHTLFEELSELVVGNSVVWEGLLRAYTKDFNDLNIDLMKFDDYFNKYMCVEKNKKNIDNYKRLYSDYVTKINEKVENELEQEENMEKFKKEVILWTIIGISFIICFYSLCLNSISNETTVANGSNNNIIFSVESDKNIIFVNESLQMNAILDVIYVDQEYTFDWYVTDGAIRRNDIITKDGVFMSNEPGEFTVCAKLYGDSKCKVINVVLPCKEEYVFNLDGASKLVLDVKENGEVCPGTYNAKANFVNDDSWSTEFITVNRGYYDFDLYHLRTYYSEKFAVKSGDEIEVDSNITKLILKKVY